MRELVKMVAFHMEIAEGKISEAYMTDVVDVNHIIERSKRWLEENQLVVEEAEKKEFPFVDMVRQGYRSINIVLAKLKNNPKLAQFIREGGFQFKTLTELRLLVALFRLNNAMEKSREESLKYDIKYFLKKRLEKGELGWLVHLENVPDDRLLHKMDAIIYMTSFMTIDERYLYFNRGASSLGWNKFQARDFME